MSKIKKIPVNESECQYQFLCPACNETHSINQSWEFDGDYESPTISPSIRVNGFAFNPSEPGSVPSICHSWISKGKIKFFEDCTHKLAGKKWFDLLDVELIETARIYAIGCHNSTNHNYHDKPYSYHLKMVSSIALEFIHLIPEQERANVLSACWCHDVIEDCRQTYNDVKDATNERIADIAYALTNEKGRTREERANDKYYTGIMFTPCAVFVKICDRIANFQYSRDSGSKMYEKYMKEAPHFKQQLYYEKYSEMFKLLE